MRKKINNSQQKVDWARIVVQEPAEKVPEGFSSTGTEYCDDPSARVMIFVVENLQQTADQVQVAQIARVTPAVCSALGRHPVKQVEQNF
jgi:hypothetical protein